MTVTQTLIEERLSLTVPSHRNVPNKMNKGMPSVLIRSSSFTRLRQFPSCLHAYLCRYGTVIFLQWLSSYQVKLSHLLPELHNLLFIFTLYSVISLICLQSVICIVALLSAPPPSGMAFLMTCILVMAVIAFKLNLPQARQSRSKTRTNNGNKEL